MADEPTSALDTKPTEQIMGLFKELNDKGKTVIIITHDPQFAEMCKKKIEIGDGVQYEIVEDYIDPGEEIHLAWVDSEGDIPPKLLKYLKENYSVKTGYSKTSGKCFANHCDCCGAIQGNWFLFNEPDSPLSSCVDGDELIDRMRRLKIKGIPIEDDLKLDWNMGFCSNDYAYLRYGKFEELVLSSDLNNEYVSYEELYAIQSN